MSWKSALPVTSTVGLRQSLPRPLACPLEHWSSWTRWPLMALTQGLAPGSSSQPASKACIGILSASLSPTLRSSSPSQKWALSLAAPWPEPLWVIHGARQVRRRAHDLLLNSPSWWRVEGRTVSSSRDQGSLQSLKREGWVLVNPRGTFPSIRKICKR